MIPLHGAARLSSIPLLGQPKQRDKASCLRSKVEAAIEALIEALDAIDGDADAEGDIREDDAGDAGEVDEDREPILSWTESGRQTFGPARYGDVSVWDEDEQ